MKRDRLSALRALADLKAQRSAARLAGAQSIVARLQDQDAALRREDRSETVDLAELAARERHSRWRQEHLARLAVELAQANARAQPLREAHARDNAREKVLGRLLSRRRR
ncbi:MAG: hypothetical protein WBA25_00710 [Jannaschia sp.]